MKVYIDDESIKVALKEIEKFIAFDKDVVIEGRAVRAYGWKFIKNGNSVIIEYSEKHTFFAALKELFVGSYYAEKNPKIAKLGVMVDCARNAVMNIPAIKRLIVYLALLGYNFLEIYMEDCLKVDGEEGFGYMRGAYGKDELREIDAYAQMFGVELIPCIQTLAHYNQLFTHPEYACIRDKGDTLLIGEDKTYELIDKILKTVSECFSSRNINLGMDEAHNAGRGKYYDKYGYVDKYDLLLQHLNKVIALCEKYGFSPAMWSDMIFKGAFKGEYYVSEKSFPTGYLTDFPENIKLIYWDYYHNRKEDYDSMFRLHHETKRKICFAGGIWTWRGFAPYNKYTELTTAPALDACIENGIDEVLMTMWGDNGGECSRFSVISSLIFVAEKAIDGKTDKTRISAIAEKISGYTYRELLMLDVPNNLSDKKVEFNVNPSKYLLFSDPLMPFFDGFIRENFERKYKEYFLLLNELSERKGVFADLFGTQAKLCKVLSNKAQLSVNLKNAYDGKNIIEMKKSVEKIDLIIADVKDFYRVFKKQWHRENKSFGFEVQDIRIGGLIMRLEHVKEIIQDFIDGKIDKIEALEEKRHTLGIAKHEDEVSVVFNNYSQTVTAGIL